MCWIAYVGRCKLSRKRTWNDKKSAIGTRENAKNKSQCKDEGEVPWTMFGNRHYYNTLWFLDCPCHESKTGQAGTTSLGNMYNLHDIVILIPMLGHILKCPLPGTFDTSFSISGLIHWPRFVWTENQQRLKMSLSSPQDLSPCNHLMAKLAPMQCISCGPTN